MKMKVLYDVTRLLNRIDNHTPTGIDRVDVNYLYHFLNSKQYKLNAVYQNHGLLIYLDDYETREIAELAYGYWCLGSEFQPRFSKDIKDRTLGSKVSFLRKNSFHRYVSLVDPRIVNDSKNGKKIYVNNSHHGLLSSDIFAELKYSLGYGIVFFIHDIIPCEYPEFVRSGDDLAHEKRLHNVGNLADLILVNSQYTERMLGEFFCANNIINKNILVSLIGGEEFLQDAIDLDTINPRIKGVTESNYFLYIGTIEPRKNHLLLINIWRDFLKELKDPPKLIIIGKRGWNIENIISHLDRRDWNNIILELSDLNDNDLRFLIDRSNSLLFPSFIEGWGMPIVEVLSRGKPVVCSNLEVFREASAGCAEYIDLLDGLKWKETILQLSENNSLLRKELLKKASSFNPPVWASTFQALDNYLKEMKLGKIPIQYRSSVSNSKSKINVYKKFKSNDEIITTGNDQDIIRYKAKKSFMSFILSNSQKRKLDKFSRSPIKFLSDSKNPYLKNIGIFLSRG